MPDRPPRSYILDTVPAPPWLGPTMAKIHALGLALAEHEAARLLLAGIESDTIGIPTVVQLRDFDRWVAGLWWEHRQRGVRAVPVWLHGRLRARLALRDNGLWGRSAMPEQPVVVLRQALRWVYEG